MSTVVTGVRKRLVTTTGKLKLPDNITLVSLPPYAPELNPMENVWDYLRGNELSHLVWDSYEAMVAACAKAWRFLVEAPTESDQSPIVTGRRSMRKRTGISY
jgi:hypothetical protein